MTPAIDFFDDTTSGTLDAFAHGLAYSSRSPVLRAPLSVGLDFEEISQLHRLFTFSRAALSAGPIIIGAAMLPAYSPAM